jgi:hypothetical protein
MVDNWMVDHLAGQSFLGNQSEKEQAMSICGWVEWSSLTVVKENYRLDVDEETQVHGPCHKKVVPTNAYHVDIHRWILELALKSQSGPCEMSSTLSWCA